MRPATLLTTLCALSTSAIANPFDIGSTSVDISDLTASAASLYSHYATQNPTQLYSEANSLATGALATLSELAATATGSLGSSLRAEYTSLKSQLAGAQATASSYLGKTGTPTTGGSSPSASGSAAPSTGLAKENVVPIAAVGVGMAVLGFM
jgi:hypothetical protein